MARKIEFEGRIIEVPEDASDDEVSEIIAQSADASASTSADTNAASMSATPPVIAGRDVRPATPDDIKFDKPRTADRGFWGELGAALNPREIVTGLYDQALKLGLNLASPMAAEDEGMGLDMTDLGAPDLPSIYRESTRRGGANESVLGMYGGLTGQALLASLGIGAGRLVRSAPTRAAAAEADYARATGATPPVAREMLNRRMVVAADPTDQAATASSRAATINAERAAIPPPPAVRGPKGRFEVNTDPAWAVRSSQRASLRAQAQLESNIATILEAMPKTRTLGGAAVKGATKFATNRLNWLAYGPAAAYGVDPLALGPISVAHLLRTVGKELTKTNQWKTAAPMYRYRFMNAMLRGDQAAAAEVGAIIASGKGGSSESSSSTSTPTTARERREGPHVEWPVDPNGRDENADLLLSTPPSKLLPERFRNARNVTYGSPTTKQINNRSDLHGLFGRPFDPRPGPLPRNTVLVSAQDRDEAATYAHETWHSAYAGDLTPDEKASFKQLVDPISAAFTADQTALLYPTQGRSKYDYRSASIEAAKKYPKAVAIYTALYSKDPDRMYDEMFSELGAQYMANPSAFKRAYPKIYGWYRDLVGKEFVSGVDRSKE